MEKKTAEEELLSTMMRLLVNRRWAKTTRKQRSEIARQLNEAKKRKKQQKALDNRTVRS